MRINEETVAVVTGAGSGIGRSLAQKLSQLGVSLAIADIDERGLEETAEILKDCPGLVTAHNLDVSKPEEVSHLAVEVERKHGRANLLINNAGVALHGTIEQLSIPDIEWLMGINFWGVVYGVKMFLPILQREPESHIVNISSVFGFIGFPGQGAYAASKFAVRGFTEALRHELEGSRVRVSVVHPGGIKTRIARNARPGSGATLEGLAAEIDNFDRVARTSPDKAAERIVQGIARNQHRILIGPDAWLIDRVQRWMPGKYYKLLGRLAETGNGSRKFSRE